MVSSVITNNSSWEILTNNLITFKRQDWVKDEKLLVFLGFTKKSKYRQWGHEKPI